MNGIIKTFRAFFKYAYQEEYVVRNPMLKVKWQREVIPVITTFTNDEVRKMICYYTGKRFLDIRNKLIMIILFDSGIRNTEFVMYGWRTLGKHLLLYMAKVRR